MAVTAAQVKAMRERTGLGMMECKKALVEADGDMEKAIDNVRKAGQAKADKKAGRVAAEGVIASAGNGHCRVLVEVNCETDFVAKDANFREYADLVAQQAVATRPDDLEALMAAVPEGQTESLEQLRQALVTKLGENLRVRRFALVDNPDATVALYLHGQRIGVLVELLGGNEELAKDVAMHVAASRPLCVAPEDIDQELLAREREIFASQAATSGKPEAIQEKMVQGKLSKYLSEVTLLGQAFVKDPDMTVGKLLEKHNARVAGFVRFEVGDGIEKKAEDFVAEVMKQAQG